MDLDFWENLTPSGSTFLANLGQSPSRGDRAIILIPLHLGARLNLRRASIYARAVVDAASSPVISMALYKASKPTISKPLTLDASTRAGGSPGGTGLFDLTLCVDLGSNTMQNGHDGEIMHFTAENEYPVLPEMFPFIALSASPMVDTEIFSPHASLTLPSVSFVGAELGPGLSAGTVKRWPQRLGLDRGRRAFPPYLCVRSSIGVRLYGDPEFG